MTVPDYEIPRDVVPPGNQTGTYYIPISNLPFNVSWQEVKDHVRQVCTVDHVEIFPKSTSGWVRVKGFEHFRAAFELLNGKEFKGRAVIADDRNAGRPLKVRDLMVSGSGTSANRPASSSAKAGGDIASESSLFSGGPVSYPSSIGISSPTSTASSAYGQDSGSFNMSVSASSYMASPEAMFSHGAVMPSYDMFAAAYPQPTLQPTYGCYGSGIEAQQSFFGYQAAPDRQPASYSQPVSYAVQPIQPYSDFYPAAVPGASALTDQLGNLTMGGGGGGAFTGGVVLTEKRGIHIRELSRRASEEQVRRMICEAAGREASLINSVDVPTDKDSKPRGHAIVHFNSAELARKMVTRLHGVEFKGRKLQVRLLKEGETVGSSGGAAAAAGSLPKANNGHGLRSGKHHSSPSSRKDDGRRAEQRGKDKEWAPDRGEKKAAAPSSSSKKAPLVVGGGSLAAEAASSVSSSPSPKGREKGREKHGSKKSAVVIADGSSRRIDKS